MKFPALDTNLHTYDIPFPSRSIRMLHGIWTRNFGADSGFNTACGIGCVGICNRDIATNACAAIAPS